MIKLAKFIKEQEEKNGIDATLIGMNTKTIKVQKKTSQVCSELGKLFCSKKDSPTFYKIALMFTITTNLSWHSIYASAAMDVNKFVISAIIGASWVIGMLFSMVVLPHIKDKEILGYLTAILVILSITVVRYNSENLSNMILYFLFALQIISLGVCSNVQWFILA